MRIWESNNPYEVISIRQSKIESIFCFVQRKLFGPFFFASSTVSGTVNLDMLQESLMPILEAENPDGILLQQDGEPSHFHKETTDNLNSRHPEKRIVRGGPITRPHHSPDLTPLIFFPGYIKDTPHVLYRNLL
jgi:hypothetical protein